ncbi:carboxypeptidase-like regulatory domain-containing protein [Hymenobacter volaticus]|uniref:Carboxypeptidase-like regulatory domain-containing protein n=1 Tax=Hymenobacter volaticus TaxID=2932254 RepID=A0ABY4G5E7_9BACT|nr:carboxypeptidase-like regulatory domain-containing protein [Hymenobacter volaticus]UOQ66077.1 carboxypeptidase-like regulatory domain-containing protein [Hymenobacter volaticus]
MSTRTTLTIPTPCHQNWSAMTATAQGRHCAACNNVVVDFTQKTDAEILALLGQASSTCGRFREDQLQRPLLPSPMPASHWRTWLAATAAVLGLSSVVAPVAQAQQSPPTEQAVKKGKIKAPLRSEPIPLGAPLVVRGRVVDKKTKNGLPGVTVLVKNTTVGVSTNPDGTFELQIPASVPPIRLWLSFTLAIRARKKAWRLVWGKIPLLAWPWILR